MMIEKMEKSAESRAVIGIGIEVKAVIVIVTIDIGKGRVAGSLQEKKVEERQSIDITENGIATGLPL